MDNLPELTEFSDKLEKACISTVESGKMTKDLALIVKSDSVQALNTQEFIGAVRETLEASL